MKLFKSKNIVENSDDILKSDKHFKLQGRRYFHGLDIAIENKKGSTRKGIDDDGTPWETLMKFDYGYIRKTLSSSDKEKVDVYLGEDENSEKAFIVNQNNPFTGKFDEQKIMLGFDSEEEAKKAYLSQYNNPKFFGSIKEIPFDEFKKKALATDKKPGIIKAFGNYIFRKSLNDNEKQEFNQNHPRNKDGQFTNKYSPITGVLLPGEKDKFYKHLFKEFNEQIVGEYETPLSFDGKSIKIRIKKEDFAKLISILRMGRKKFGELIDSGEYDWNKTESKDHNRYKILGVIKELLTKPDEILENKNKNIKSDFIFKLKKEDKVFYVAFTFDNDLTTGYTLHETRIDKITGKKIYTQKEGMPKSTSLKKHDLLLQLAKRDQFSYPNIIICDSFVKGNLFKAFGKQFDLFAPKQEELFTGQEKDGKKLLPSEKNSNVRRWKSPEEKPEEKKLGLKLFHKPEVLTKLEPGMIRKEGDKEYMLTDDYKWEEVKKDKEGSENSEKPPTTNKGSEKPAKTEGESTSQEESKPEENKKEPWKMTWNEYSANDKADAEEKDYPYSDNVSRSYHKFEIEEALKEGKTIPPEVLKDYPDLIEKYKPEGTLFEENSVESSSREEKKEKLKTITEKVEESLNEKQKNKEFKDAGERVQMSKKEMAAFRKFSVEDLDKLDNASAFTLVTKDRVIPELDIEKMRADGEPSGLIWFKKKLRDLVSQKPENKELARKIYVEKLPEYFDVINKAKSIDEIINTFRGIFTYRRASYRGNSKTYTFRTSPEQETKNKEFGFDKIILESVFGKPFLNFVTLGNDTAKEQVAYAKSLNGLTAEQSEKEYKDSLTSLENLVKRKKEEEAAYSDERWQRELMAESSYGIAAMKDLGISVNSILKAQRNDPAKYKEMVEKYKEYRKKRLENIKPAHNSYAEFIQKYPKSAPREDNWDWLDNTEKKERETSGDMKIHDNPPLDFIKRTNGREVLPTEITPETIMKDFGFKSVQFGHYMQDKVAREHIKHFIGALKDLEDVLGVDIKKINEEGGLSLAFGARGRGHAAAHYEPTFKIINLTKSHGDGSTAHEWFHYLDHLLGGANSEGIRSHNGGFASHQVESDTKNDPVLEAVKGVNDAIKKGYGAKKVTFQPTTSNAYLPGLKSTYQEKGLDSAIAFLISHTRDKDRKFGFEILAKLQGKPLTVELPRTKSEFLENAESFRSDYWVRPLEMFARAAEAYVQDKLKSNEMYDNYLVGGNNVEEEDMKWDPMNMRRGYPQGEERTRINTAFDKLFEELKKKGYEKKYEYPEKRIDEFVDLQKSLELEEMIDIY